MPSVCGQARTGAALYCSPCPCSGSCLFGAFRETRRANVQICPPKRDEKAILHPEQPEIQAGDLWSPSARTPFWAHFGKLGAPACKYVAQPRRERVFAPRKTRKAWSGRHRQHPRVTATKGTAGGGRAIAGHAGPLPGPPRRHALHASTRDRQAHRRRPRTARAAASTRGRSGLPARR